MSKLLQFFGYAHLPVSLQSVSKMFHDFVNAPTGTPGAFYCELEAILPDNIEKEVCLKKVLESYSKEGDDKIRLLLEAKDCAVRSFIFK